MPSPPRVLIIAPANGSAPLYDQLDSTAGALRDLPGAVPLAGDVRERDILEAIDTRGPFDGIIISGHATGDGAGIVLEDGELTAGAIAAYVNKAGAQWIILAARYSEAMATILLLATTADLLAATGEIEDRAAWRVTRMIAQAIENAGSFRDAIQQIGPAALGKMRFYANQRQEARPAAARQITGSGFSIMADYRDGSRIEEAIEQLRKEIAALAVKVTLMEYQIGQLHGDADRNTRGNSQLTWTIVAGSLVIAIVMIAMIAIDLLKP